MNAPAVKVLVVDDEPPIRRFLRTSLTANGYHVIEAANGADALAKLADGGADVIVLDFGLPDVSGLDLIRRLREEGSAAPIVVLSSRSDERGKVEALDLGADDYVTKPFGMDELIARIRAALRHRLQTAGRAAGLQGGRSLGRSRATDRQGARCRGEALAEGYDILRLLVAHAGKVLTHHFILREVWGGEADPQYVRIYVRQLRQKIEAIPERPQHILTETGVGYRLRAPD